MSLHTEIATVTSVKQWQDLASRTFVPLTCRAASPGFEASLRTVEMLHRLTITEVDTGPVVVQRLDDASHQGDGSLLLIIQEDSTSTVVQDGRSSVLAPGTAAILDTRRPYEIGSDSAQRQIVARLQPQVLAVLEGWIESITATTIAESQPLLGVFRGIAESVTHGTDMSEAGRHEVGSHAVDMLVAMMHDVARTTRGQRKALHSDVVTRCSEYIEERLGDPGLSVSALASHEHVSVRTLHHAFESTGHTPGAFIRRERLRRARQLLEETDRTVAQIVHLCGFGDSTAFARAFRKQYGMPPTAWRAQSRDRALARPE